MFSVIIFSWASVKRDESLLFNERNRTYSNSHAYSELLVGIGLVQSKAIYIQERFVLRFGLFRK